jgi:hypothetical protein
MLVFSWENLQNVWHEECLLRSFKVTQDRCFCLFSSEKWLKESRSLVSIQGLFSWYFVDWRWWPSTHTHTTPYYYLVSFLFDCGSAADVCFCARFESTRVCLRFCPFFHARLDSTRRGGECVGEAKKHTTSSSLMLIQVGLINTYETGSPLRDGNKAKRAVLKTGRRNRRRTAGRQSVWPVANKTAKVSLSLSLLS